MELNLLGIPFSFGQPFWEVTEAARCFRHHGLNSRLNKNFITTDLGDLNFNIETPSDGNSLIKNISAVSEANFQISRAIENLDLTNHFLLNIGGDHGMGLGTVHGVLSHNPETVVIWADAHCDINTPESSPSGNFHGMPLSFLLGIAFNTKHFDWIKNRLRPNKLIFFGVRDIDPGEQKIIDALGIQYFTSKDINHWGAKDLIEMALHKADPFNEFPLHLSFDVDLIDPAHLRSTGIHVQNGPRLEEVFLMGGLIAETGRLRSMDIVEFNPSIGTNEEIRAGIDLTLDFIELTLGHLTPKMVSDKKIFRPEDFYESEY